MTFLQAGPDSAAGIVVAIVSGTVSRVLTTPFTAALVTVLYFDLRVRREGFDIQLLAERIGVTAPLRSALPPVPERPAEKPPYWPPPPGWRPGGTGSE